MFHLFEKIRNKEPYLIAEMSANHGGDPEHALTIVREAAAAGADCVKKYEERYAMFKELYPALKPSFAKMD